MALQIVITTADGLYVAEAYGVKKTGFTETEAIGRLVKQLTEPMTTVQPTGCINIDDQTASPGDGEAAHRHEAHIANLRRYVNRLTPAVVLPMRRENARQSGHSVTADPIPAAVEVALQSLRFQHNVDAATKVVDEYLALFVGAREPEPLEPVPVEDVTPGWYWMTEVIGDGQTAEYVKVIDGVTRRVHGWSFTETGGQRFDELACVPRKFYPAPSPEELMAMCQTGVATERPEQ